MFACCSWNLNWTVRRVLFLVLAGGSFLYTTYGAYQIGAGLYLRYKLQTDLYALVMRLENRRRHVASINLTPYMLMFIGIWITVLYTYMTLICLWNSDWKLVYRNKFLTQTINILPLFFFFCTVWFLLAITIKARRDRRMLEKVLTSGFKDLLQFYLKEPEVKVLIDKLQMQYECCGAEEYTEWFDVAWVDPQYYLADINDLSVAGNDKPATLQSVPYSCCAVKSLRPCINEDIHNSSLHWNYNYKQKEQLTINLAGCGKLIYQRAFAVPLFYLVNYGYTFFWYSILLSLLFRIAQTSASIAITWEDPQLEAPGYLIAFGPQPMPPKAPTTLAKMEQRQLELEAVAYAMDGESEQLAIKRAEATGVTGKQTLERRANYDIVEKWRAGYHTPQHGAGADVKKKKKKKAAAAGELGVADTGVDPSKPTAPLTAEQMEKKKAKAEKKRLQKEMMGLIEELMEGQEDNTGFKKMARKPGDGPAPAAGAEEEAVPGMPQRRRYGKRMKRKKYKHEKKEVEKFKRKDAPMRKLQNAYQLFKYQELMYKGSEADSDMTIYKTLRDKNTLGVMTKLLPGVVPITNLIAGESLLSGMRPGEFVNI